MLFSAKKQKPKQYRENQPIFQHTNDLSIPSLFFEQSNCFQHVKPVVNCRHDAFTTVQIGAPKLARLAGTISRATPKAVEGTKFLSLTTLCALCTVVSNIAGVIVAVWYIRVEMS